MAILTQQNLIEQSEFSGGWAPDMEPTGTPENVLPDVLNLLPDLGGSDALVTRKGFKRIREELGASGHYVKHIWPFRGNSTSYLICVTSNDTAAVNNVRLYAINLEDLTVARIDDAGVEWANPDRSHWGMGIQEVFYGGSPGNEVYSWDPTGPTWDPAANINANWDVLVDSITPGAGEVARDFAFKGTEKVLYPDANGNVYTPAKGIRFDTWEDGQRYQVGDKVSRKEDIGGETYWRSYRCTKGHKSSDGVNDPVTDDGDEFWKKVRLPLPTNDDDETSDKWYFVPIAPGSSVAQWHADRFWIRYDGQGDKSRVLFSAPVRPEKGEDVPGVVFSMRDFAPGNDARGPGGGWWSFNDGKKEGVIEAMWSYGQYLIVFKRQSTWVLTGQSEETFSARRLDRHVGCVGPSCVVELDGLVYFLSDDGLYVTDGTAVEAVRGVDKVRPTLIARIDAMHAEGAAGNLREPTMWVWDRRIWFALPCDGETQEEETWVYDPDRQAFYYTDLPVLAAHTARHQGIEHFYFSAPATYNANADLVFQYDHVDADNEDDTGAAAYASQAIAWFARTAWWNFGTMREQRRIRRVWAVVKGALTHTITAYKDWVESSVATTATVVAGTDPVHIEGEWFADAHAVSFKVSGSSAPAALYGVAVDTEPRRKRYHVA